MKINIKKIFIHLLIFSLVFHNGYQQSIDLQDATAQADSLTSLFSSLNTQIKDITNNQSNVSNSQDQTGTILKTISSISYMFFFVSPAGVALAIVALSFQIMAAKQDAKVAKAIYAMRDQVISLSSNIDDLKVSVLQSLSQLDENLSFRSIDQDIYLLKALLSQYSQYNDDVDLLLYRQLCGEQLHSCNKAVISLASGLTDYLRAVKNNQGWNRQQISLQYLTYSGLLLNAVTALVELNLRIAIQEKNLNAADITVEQSCSYSRAGVLMKALNDLNNNFSSLIANSYDTYSKELSLKTNSYNDLVAQDNYLLLGFYRAQAGDQLNSIIKSNVANRSITMQSNMYVNVQYILDSNDKWAICPQNSFLRGIHLSDKYLVHNIEKIQCNTFIGQYHDQCSVVDVLGFQTPNNWALCGNGKFVAGIKRGDGDYLTQMTQLYCCSMTSKVPDNIVQASSNIITRSTYFRPTRSDVDMSHGTKFPISYIRFFRSELNGNFNVGYKSRGFEIEKTQSISVLKNFDNSGGIGRCPLNMFMYGFYQNDGTAFSHIENLNCVKYKNQYWKKCFYQDVPSYQANKSCSGSNTCAPTTLKCEDGSFLAGFVRGDENNMYGVKQVFCCNMNSTGANDINEIIDTMLFFN